MTTLTNKLTTCHQGDMIASELVERKTFNFQLLSIAPEYLCLSFLVTACT